MSSFAEATAVTPIDSHTYSANFPGDWCIGSVPHGGFITSCFLRVASTHFRTSLSKQNQPHTITLHLEFLRRTQEGPATFTVKDTKLGRQTSTIHVTLTQDGRDEVVGYITNSNIHTETGVSFKTGYVPHPPIPSVDLHALKTRGEDANWLAVTSMPFASFRKATQHLKFHFPRKGQPLRSIADEWVCFQSGEKFTSESLGFLADMWPQIVEQYRTGEDPHTADPPKDVSVEELEEMAKESAWGLLWYPTLLLNLDVKKVLPEEGVEWLFARVRAKKIRNGRMDLEVVILDEEGDIVALSHHVSLVVDSSRNTKKRRKQDGGESML